MFLQHNEQILTYYRVRPPILKDQKTLSRRTSTGKKNPTPNKYFKYPRINHSLWNAESFRTCQAPHKQPPPSLTERGEVCIKQKSQREQTEAVLRAYWASRTQYVTGKISSPFEPLGHKATLGWKQCKTGANDYNSTNKSYVSAGLPSPGRTPTNSGTWCLSRE